MVAGAGDRLLGLAAARADGLSLAAVPREVADLPPSPPPLADAESVAERVAFLRRQAADRVDAIELSIVNLAVVVTPNRRAAAERLRATTAPYLTVDQILDSPKALLGTVPGMAEQLRERRARFGFSLAIVTEPSLRDFAPVIERLAGDRRPRRAPRATRVRDDASRSGSSMELGLGLGLAAGGREDDFTASGPDIAARGPRADALLAPARLIRREGDGIGPPPATAGGSALLFGGMSKATPRRIVTHGTGWVIGDGEVDGFRASAARVRAPSAPMRTGRSPAPSARTTRSPARGSSGVGSVPPSPPRTGPRGRSTPPRRQAATSCPRWATIQTRIGSISWPMPPACRGQRRSPRTGSAIGRA